MERVQWPIRQILRNNHTQSLHIIEYNFIYLVILNPCERNKVEVKFSFVKWKRYECKTCRMEWIVTCYMYLSATFLYVCVPLLGYFAIRHNHNTIRKPSHTQLMGWWLKNVPFDIPCCGHMINGLRMLVYTTVRVSA